VQNIKQLCYYTITSTNSLKFFLFQRQVQFHLYILHFSATEDLYYRHMDIIKKLMIELGRVDAAQTGESLLCVPY